jgi:hypothetical protein
MYTTKCHTIKAFLPEKQSSVLYGVASPRFTSQDVNFKTFAFVRAPIWN